MKSRRSVRELVVLVAAIFTSQTASGQGYYPLGVGDRLDYGDYDFPGQIYYRYSDIITAETTMTNGKSYAVRRSWTRWGFMGWHFLRQEGSKVYSLPPMGTGSEEVFMDFSLQDGDTVAAWSTDTDTGFTIVRVGEGMHFGRQLRSWVFSSEGSSPNSEPAWWQIIDSIGFADSWYSPGARMYLMGAIVGGIEYGTITAIEQDAWPVSEIADILTLDAFPNPFNPSTTIRYGLPNRSHVTLTVFNTLGQEIAALVDREMDAGYHEAAFDASGLASGVYLYRLRAGIYVETRKLVVVR